MRLSDGFVPAALLAASLAGGAGPAFRLALAAFAVGLLSLFSAFGARIAFARQPSIRDVRGSVKAALLLQLGGMAAACLIQALWIRRDGATWLPLLAAGGLLNIEHTFYEYLFAAGDRRGATLCQALAGLLVAAGLLLSGGDAGSPWIPGTAGLSALVACVVSAATGGGRKGKINAAVVRCAPRAALQAAAYPLAAFGVSRLLPVFFAPAFFAGLTLYALCRTPFRRSGPEAPPMNLALLITSAAALAVLLAVIIIPALPALFSSVREEIIACCAMILTACACAFAVYGSIRKSNDD